MSTTTSTSTPAPTTIVMKKMKSPPKTITIERKVIGWQHLDLTRSVLGDYNGQKDDETDEAYEKRLDGVWEIMCEEGYEVNLDEVDADDIGVELPEIDGDDYDFMEWVMMMDNKWDETKKKCVLTDEGPDDWNEGDEVVDTEIGPVRDVYAELLPKIKELYKVVEKDNEIARLKREMSEAKAKWDEEMLQMREAKTQLDAIKRTIW